MQRAAVYAQRDGFAAKQFVKRLEMFSLLIINYTLLGLIYIHRQWYLFMQQDVSRLHYTLKLIALVHLTNRSKMNPKINVSHLFATTYAFRVVNIIV